MEEILFSILIANYNNGKYISMALESILDQTYNNWEVILIDDASTDNSLDIVQPYITDKKIKLFNNLTNKGCGYTKRRCVELASGEICGFLDPDDALTPDALEVMVKEHSLHPEYSLINSTHYVCDETLNVKYISTDPGPIPKDKIYLIKSGYVSHFAAFKMIFYQKTEGIDLCLKKAVDQDLYYKLEDYGPIGFIHKPLYFYRHHSASISLGDNKAPALSVHMKVLESAIKRRMGMKEFKIRKKKKIALALLTELHRIRYERAKQNRKYFKAVLNGSAYLLFGIPKKLWQWSDNLFILKKHS